MSKVEPKSKVLWHFKVDPVLIIGRDKIFSGIYLRISAAETMNEMTRIKHF